MFLSNNRRKVKLVSVVFEKNEEIAETFSSRDRVPVNTHAQWTRAIRSNVWRNGCILRRRNFAYATMKSIKSSVVDLFDLKTNANSIWFGSRPIFKVYFSLSLWSRALARVFDSNYSFWPKKTASIIKQKMHGKFHYFCLCASPRGSIRRSFCRWNLCVFRSFFFFIAQSFSNEIM